MHQEIRRADATAFTFNARGPSAGFEAAVTRPRLLVVPAPPSSAPLRGQHSVSSLKNEAGTKKRIRDLSRGPCTVAPIHTFTHRHHDRVRIIYYVVPGYLKLNIQCIYSACIGMHARKPQRNASPPARVDTARHVYTE